MRPSVALLLLFLSILSSGVAHAAGGTLRVGLVAFPPGAADPRKSVSATAVFAWSPALESLTTFNEASELQPELALSWSAPAPTRWVFKLRPGVRFSNGAPCDADAVAANVNWLVTPEGRASVVARTLDAITGARALDPLTVEITTSRPDAILPRELSTLYIVEPKQWAALGPDGFALHPVGTGSFTVESWGAARIVYVANPAAWRPPKLARLELLNLPDLTPRLQAFATGRVDVAHGMGPDEQAQVEAAGGHLRPRAPMDVISIALVTGQGKPADDVRVRRALNYAVNKEALTRVLLHGLALPASQGAVHGLFGFNDSLQPYPYDPDKARALLKEAGYGNGFDLDTEIIISANASDAAVYEMVARDLAAVGVRMTLKPIPLAQMMKVVNQGAWSGDAFSMIFGAVPTFDPLRTLRLHSCLWPKPWYCDQGVTAKLQSALAEFDDAKRAAITREILAFYRDQATAIYLYELPLLDAVGKRVTGYAPQRTRINYETIAVE